MFKAKPQLLVGYARSFGRFDLNFARMGLIVIQPDELAPLKPGERLEEQLIQYVARYRLETFDAAILLEARRAGLDAIVTEDPDLRRAATDFDVYTWL